MKAIRPLLIVATVILAVILVLISRSPEPSPTVSSPQPERSRHSIASPQSAPDSPYDPREPAAVPSASPSGKTAFPLRQGDEKPNSIVKEELTESEQRSLAQAFSEARRAVRAIPESWTEREENLGYDFYALHPKQKLTARFGAEAVQFVSSERTYTGADAEQPSTSWEARMRLRSFAGRDVMMGASPEKSTESVSRVEYRRAAGLTEWYDNGTEAMEHGFTVAGRPGHLADGEEVVLEMDLEGLEVMGRDSENGSDLVFRDGEREVLGYEKLVVFDATGKELPARMEPTEDGFLLAYHDAGASYPVTVDPLIVNEEAKFNRTDTEPGDGLGHAVSISGNTAVVGAPFHDGGGSDSGSSYVFIGDGESWFFQSKLTASDAAAGDQFGESVSISGGTVVVGAHGNDDEGANSGSAYVFTRSGESWNEQAKLGASDAAASDFFGNSVSISGDTVVVGAHGNDDEDSQSGSAYVFTRGEFLGSVIWSQQSKLTASDAATGDFFGYSVSISGNTVVVGAYGDDDGGSQSGSAYVFTRSSSAWSQQAKLTASDAWIDDQFGRAVSISGDRVVVGSPGNDDDGGSSGSAYVFIRSTFLNTWSEESKLTASDAAGGDEFGGTVSISDETVVVGAVGNDEGGSDSGSAYVFTRINILGSIVWSEQAQLTASDAAAGDRFGTSVSISGDTVVIGGPGNDDVGSGSGSAYAFTRTGTGWSQQAKLIATDAVPESFFGSSISISGDTVVAGVPNDDDAGSQSGSAYVFTRSGGSWSEQAKLTASDAAAFDFLGGSISISGDTVVVGATGDGSSGSAYVFTRSGESWSEQAKLTASDAAFGDRFGNSVSISGDTVVVAASGDADACLHTGSVYVFARNGINWSEQAKLTASDGAESDLFGRSVSISGNTVVVGAMPNDNSGSAYVFARSGTAWSEQAKLLASDAAAGDFFGRTVSISGDTVVVGAPLESEGGDFSGSAYVFTRSGESWSEQAKLTASDAAAGDDFGKAVSISGNTVVVGASGDDDGGKNSGSTYVFTRSGINWSEQAKLAAANATAEDRFGTSVSISGNTVAVGASRDDDAGVHTGSAYVYRLAVPSVRNLLVADQFGNTVTNGGNASAFDALLIGTSQDHVFTLTNSGEEDLDLQSIALGGADSEQFGLSFPDISPSGDLGQSESMNLAVTFQPKGASGLRNAILIISSNDANTPVYSVNLSGLGLSDSEDADGDGMNDWAEYGMRGFGFDWETSQESLVSDYYALAPRAGLVTLDDVAGMQANSVLLNVDPDTNRADFTIQLGQSDDLDPPFNPIFADPARISVDAFGRIVYEVDAPAGKRFYIMEVGP